MLLFNRSFEKKLLEWKKFDIAPAGNTFKISGFEQYNYLVDLNLLVDPAWITCPLNDRSLFITSPFNVKIARPWRPPTTTITLDQFFETRVREYCQHNVKLNLCWSGGIDSTGVVVAFLKHCSNLSQLRIVYTNMSIIEHPEFFKFLETNFPQVEKFNIDQRNTALPALLDGIAITGDPCDEMLGCLDPDSDYCYDSSLLDQSWKSIVSTQTKDTKFIDFLEAWFNLSHRPIESILEARWWLFMQTHVQGGVFQNFLNLKNMFPNTSADVGFYDCYEFEDYIYHNTHLLRDFANHKEFLKSYIFAFDHNQDFQEHSRKVRSKQLIEINSKIQTVNDNDWVFLCDNYSVQKTKNLPLLSVKELSDTFGNSVDHYFNFNP